MLGWTFVAAICLAVAVAAAHASPPPMAIARGEVLTAGPYLQDLRPDGALVIFETTTPLAAEVVVDLADGPRRFPSAAGTHHEVRIGGLPPGRHNYRVIVGGVVVGGGSLAPATTGEEFSFLVVGDTRDVETEHARTVAAMMREPADLVLHLGDMVREGGHDADWSDFFRIEAPLLAATPLYAALGNHELLGDEKGDHFRRFFAGPAERDAEATWYRFRFGNALFIELDGNRADSPAQADWLARTLDVADDDAALRHVFVYTHQPPLSNGIFCGLPAAQQRWMPLFARHHVRAVFSGHEHHYERLLADGVRYFISGGGGAWLIPKRGDCGATNAAPLERFEVEHHFLRVRVRGDHVAVDALTPAGAVIDSITLQAPTEHAPVPVPVAHERAPAAAPSPIGPVSPPPAS